MRILELTNYSAGICGVGARAKKEAEYMASKGHTVKIFSSCFIKGAKGKAPARDRIGKVEIMRFPSMKLGGESFMRWNFLDEAVKFKPDIIIAHGYRHYHTYYALKAAKLTGAKCFLVTHAPFVMSTRSPHARIAVSLYDKFIAPRLLSKFDKIIAITRWEIPFLLSLGARKDNIAFIPNSIPDEFYSARPKQGKGIFFLGRISPIKNLEVLIESVKGMKVPVSLIGPAESAYKRKLQRMIKNERAGNISFLGAVDGLKEKISLIDKHDIMILPSKFESFGQVLIEAMARGKIVIASGTPGAREIISDRKNGFIFDSSNPEQLRQIITDVLSMPSGQRRKMQLAAMKKAKEYQMSRVMAQFSRIMR